MSKLSRIQQVKDALREAIKNTKPEPLEVGQMSARMNDDGRDEAMIAAG